MRMKVTPIEKLIELRKEKLKKIREKCNPYPHKFPLTSTLEEIIKTYGKLKNGERTGKKVKVCGRIISRREMGRSTFCHLSNFFNRLQIYLREDIIGGEGYRDFLELIDIGDFIGVYGEVFKTRSGELSVIVEKWEILSKSLRPLPEKWHGLKDIEIKYRQRYLDLISNQDSCEVFFKRSRVISLIRKYLDDKGFLEVETPILQHLASGAIAKPFKTVHHALDSTLYLRIAPEIFLKELIIGGMEKIYEIGKSFRNEGIDKRHNPEFTMLEVYQAYSDYTDMMDLCEGLIRYISEHFGIKLKFERISLREIIKQKLNFDIVETMSGNKLIDVAEKLKLDISGIESERKILEHIFEKCIQPDLKNPTIVFDYPLEYSPLAKRKDDFFAERFEMFINGIEIANAYSELNDPQEQMDRFLKLKEDIELLDKDFILALEYGMPPCGGLGIGIDRLIMALFGEDSIKDVLLFPLLRKT